MYGFVNEESGPVFGLNQGVILTSMEFNPNAGSNNSKSDAVDFTFLVNSKEYHHRIYDLPYGSDVYHENVKINEGNENYAKTHKRELDNRLKTITHFMTAAGVSNTDIKTALSNDLSSFEEWANIMVTLIQPNFGIHIDLFFQYQWSIKPNSTRTFLELPKNFAGGVMGIAKFAVPGTTEEWNPKQDSTGLYYTSGSSNIHPFKRSRNFMDSNKARLQTLEGNAESDPTSGTDVPDWIKD